MTWDITTATHHEIAAWWSHVADSEDHCALALQDTLGTHDAAILVATSPTADHFTQQITNTAATDGGPTTTRWAKAWHCWQPRIPKDPRHRLHQAHDNGIHLITPTDPDWPTSLNALGPAAPNYLWLRGTRTLTQASHNAITMVGARAATGYGRDVAADLAYDLAAAGHPILSGAAFGIDAACHRAALAAGGTTTAVLACGVDITYPRQHHTLLQEIATHGAIISEYPPGCPVARYRFLSRNRILAALGAATIVVEAAARSGALSTARWAADVGKPLGAVPGPVTSPASHGCHTIIRDMQATLVTTAQHVQQLAGKVGDAIQEELPGLQRPRDALSAKDARILDTLHASRPLSVAAIAVDAGVPNRSALAALHRLHAQGFATQQPAGDPDAGWIAG